MSCFGERALSRAAERAEEWSSVTPRSGIKEPDARTFPAQQAWNSRAWAKPCERPATPGPRQRLRSGGLWAIDPVLRGRDRSPPAERRFPTYSQAFSHL